MPFAQSGVCPFECCHIGKWTAVGPSTALAARDAAAPPAFAIKDGEDITALEGWMVTSKPGEIHMKAAHKFDDFSAPAGASLYLLSRGGEGYSMVWYNGKVHSAEVYAETVHPASAGYPWDVVSLAESTWWVLVKNARGATGWLLRPSGFKGMDACGQQ